MKEKNVKLFAASLTAALALTLTGCSQESGKTSSVIQAAEDNAETETDTAQPELEITAEKETAADADTEAPTAAQVLSQMNVGWNLGNTFDAWGAPNPINNETYWGNPKTTKEMIDAIRAQGFNTIRIPVTWSENVGTAPEYKIDDAWLERVAEVVDYAYNEGMFVIIDTHHEPDFWLKPQREGLDVMKGELAAIWAQLSDRFEDYDYRLLFEGMNEPRVKGSAQEWSGGTDEGRAAVNELNRVFVDTVRAAGGKNATRCLIICPYGNSVTYDSITQLEVPDDKYVMVSVHLYTPYVFCYEPEGSVNEWDGTLKKDIENVADMVNTNFIEKGIPVIVTEFGAVNKTGAGRDGSQNTQQILSWLADYMEVMNGYGIKCIWWDNGIYDGQGEKFAIFDRSSCTWYAPEIADALIEYSKAE